MKIKNTFMLLPFALAVACSNASSTASGDLELKGKLSNSHGESVYLEQLSPEAIKPVDTATIDENGEFTIHAAVSEAGFYRLRITDKNFATLILDAGQHLTLTGDAQDLGNTYKVEGSPDSQLFWELNQRSARNYSERDSLQRIFQVFAAGVNVPGKTMTRKDSMRIDSMSNALEKPYSALIARHNKYLQDFIEKNLSSLASLAAIQQLPAEEFFPTYIRLDEGLYAKYPNSGYIKSFHASIASQKKLAMGTPAPEITMNTPEGKPLALSSLKGKVVLVDFWASWCGPCRAENPNVVKAYQKYKSKGFDIYSVSLDKDKDRWIAAIAKDGLEWKNHVSDLLSWQSPVVQLYNFNSIPTNVLLDKKGNIIAKNLRGEDLEKKLAEIMK
jgi:thiol-disulfide isomerase/thioredoxin